MKAIFPNKATADERANFYRAYSLKCDQPWFKLDKSSTYIRGERSAKIGGYYQADKLEQPGLYVATISGYAKTGAGKNIPDFQILNTVIIPHLFDTSNQYKLKVENKTLKSGEYHRYFVQVPPGASTMTVELSPSQGKWCGIYGYIYDPDGLKRKTMPRINPQKGKPVSYTISGNLTPGIWEVIPFAYHNLPKTSTYDMLVSFTGIEVKGGALADLNYENGELPCGDLVVTNHFGPFQGTAKGSLMGWQKFESVNITDDEYKTKFKVGENIKRVSYELEMSKETWNLFTDVAVNIVDKNGKYLINTGFSNRRTNISFKPQKAGEYTLQIIAGFAEPKKKSDEWRLDIKQIYEQAEPVGISVNRDGAKKIELYPGIPANLSYKLSKTPQILPKEFSYFGRIIFNDERSNSIAAEIPIKF